MTNWRLLEREIEDICRKEGFELDRDVNKDIIIVNTQGFDLNISYLAQELSKRGVGVEATAVKVKS